MSGPRRKLQQGRRRSAVGLGVFAAAEPAGQVVDKRQRVAQRSEMDTSPGPAPASTQSRAQDSPRDRLVDRRAKVDRFAVGPHALVPARSLSAVRISASPRARASAD